MKVIALFFLVAFVSAAEQGQDSREARDILIQRYYGGILKVPTVYQTTYGNGMYNPKIGYSSYYVPSVYKTVGVVPTVYKTVGVPSVYRTVGYVPSVYRTSGFYPYALSYPKIKILV